MKTGTNLFALLLICVFSTNCFAQSDDWKKGMMGDWKCNVDKTVEAMKEAEMPEAQMDMMKSFLPGIKMTFTADNMVMKMEAGGMDQETKATYKVLETKEEKKWIKIEVMMEGQPDAKTGEITIMSKDMMQLDTDDGSSIVFDRVKEEKEKSDD